MLLVELNPPEKMPEKVPLGESEPANAISSSRDGIRVGSEGADFAASLGPRRYKQVRCPRPLRSDRARYNRFLRYAHSASTHIPETGQEDVDRGNRIIARVVIEMHRPESGDRLIVLLAAAGHDLIEILVLDPAARWGIESQNLRAGGLRILELRVFPIADSGIQTSVHEEQAAGLRASERNDPRTCRK